MTEMASGDVLHLLQSGTVEIEGLLPWSSNYAFLARVCEGPVEVGAVYQPPRGERPLWDFAQGPLCQRELAALLVSEALRWHIVPPPVLRDAQHGPGTIQPYTHHDPARHYLTIEGDTSFRTQPQRTALPDILTNNPARKAGHVLLEATDAPDGIERLGVIDHGICVHTDPKLRTVIWEFGGLPIPDWLRADLRGLRARLADADDATTLQLNELLSEAEREALRRRLARLIDRANFPQPGPGRHYPWPPV